MVVLFVAKPVEGWSDMGTAQLLHLLSIGARNLAESRKPKEEPKEEKKEEKKEEVAPEPEKKRSGGVVGSASKRADGCAIRGKTRGKMV
jgi:hypothetical protein